MLYVFHDIIQSILIKTHNKKINHLIKKKKIMLNKKKTNTSLINLPIEFLFLKQTLKLLKTMIKQKAIKPQNNQNLFSILFMN